MTDELTGFERLNRRDDSEIVEGPRGGPRVDTDQYEQLESWTIRTGTHTPALFRLYGATVGDPTHDYLLELRDGGMTTQTCYLGFDSHQLIRVVSSMEQNPMLTVHRSPGKLLGGDDA